LLGAVGVVLQGDELVTTQLINALLERLLLEYVAFVAPLTALPLMYHW
jgi:hypothetical protein